MVGWRRAVRRDPDLQELVVQPEHVEHGLEQVDFVWGDDPVRSGDREEDLTDRGAPGQRQLLDDLAVQRVQSASCRAQPVQVCGEAFSFRGGELQAGAEELEHHVELDR